MHSAGPELGRAEAAQGRRESITALFGLYYVRLVGTARFLVDDVETAEDIVMDAFLSLHRHWSTLRDPNRAHAYLRSCVVNGARSQLRSRRVRRLRESGQSAQSAELATAEDVAASGADHTSLVGVLRTLPARQREVLVLRFYLGMSELEVAENLGISVGAVKQHSSRGLAALARVLEATS